MSATPGRLTRRPSRVLPAVLLAITAIAAGGFASWLLAAYAVDGAWPDPAVGLVSEAARMRLDAVPILIGAAVLGLLGIGLVISAIVPGEPALREILADGTPGQTAVSRRDVALRLQRSVEHVDVVQEALVSSWKRLHLLEEPSAFRNWVTQIASRAATNVVRKAARRSTEGVDQQALEDAGPESALGGATSRNVGQPERAALAGAQMEALASILQSTEENQRTCWVLCEIDGMSYREIAQMVGVSESTVRGRIARARSQILDRMKDWR